MATKLGLEGVVHTAATALTSLTLTSVTWTAQNDVKNVSIGLTKGRADVTTRNNSGWRQRRGTLKDGTVTLEIPWDPAVTFLSDLMSAFIAGSDMGLAIMDDAIATVGAEGLVSNFQVVEAPREEQLEEGMVCRFVLEPSSYTQWYTVSS